MRHRMRIFLWIFGLTGLLALSVPGLDNKPEPKRLDDSERGQYAAAINAVNNSQGQLDALGSQIVNAPDGTEGALIAVGKAKVAACRSELANQMRLALYYRLCAIHGITEPDKFQIGADGVTFEPKK